MTLQKTNTSEAVRALGEVRCRELLEMKIARCNGMLPPTNTFISTFDIIFFLFQMAFPQISISLRLPTSDEYPC